MFKTLAFPFIFVPVARRNNQKKKEKDNMETNIKKVFIAALDDFEKCYIFAPSIGKKKNIGGKTYNVTRYFNGNRDFETSIKELATKQVNKNAR